MLLINEQDNKNTQIAIDVFSDILIQIIDSITEKKKDNIDTSLKAINNIKN